MVPLGSLLFDLLLWLLLWLRYDSPAVPAWQTRNIQRAFIGWLVCSKFLLAWKWALDHSELVALITGCR